MEKNNIPIDKKYFNDDDFYYDEDIDYKQIFYR
jgi:hypothetical protein